MSEITVDAVKKFHVAELKSELSQRGLSVNGKKEELLKTINRSSLRNILKVQITTR